jgi:hypothetical protein
VPQQRWFYRNADEWNAFAQRLKLMPCPHCNRVGLLICHGFLYGFDESNSRRKTPRARRIFCSTRRAQPGCGRTFSVWSADKIRRLSLTAATLWRFLQHAVAGGIAAAIRAANSPLCDRTWQRIWKRFNHAQSTIRTALFSRCPPPPLPDKSTPAAQVLAHLHAAFPDAPCPIAACQHTMKIFFV